MNLVYDDFKQSFDQALENRETRERRIGGELKFPFVRRDGQAVDYDTVTALWEYLVSLGWKPEIDAVSQRMVGARKPGEYNDSVASCETGFCKVEFSFAHVADLFSLEQQIEALRTALRPFCDERGVSLLCYGIQPVSEPSGDLMMKKTRASVWGDFLVSNRVVPPENGHDLHLFTLNAATHCHLSVERDEAVTLVNVLNGFSGAQLALTADSSVWRGQVDEKHRCVAEKFWDWWMPEGFRVGVPEKRFEDLRDYASVIGAMRPVYIKRDGHPILINHYETFEQYYEEETATGRTPEGEEVSVRPDKADLELHNSCYWYNARISAYHTVENRTNDQQPGDALVAIPALTLGLAENLETASAELAQHDWKTLRAAREAACTDALRGVADGLELRSFATRMLEIARDGLKKRGKGEEKFLAPFEQRIESGRCPADDAQETYERGGIAALLKERSFC